MTMANGGSRTTFQLGGDAIRKAAHPRKHTANVDASLNESRAFYDAFLAQLTKARIASGDNLPLDYLSLLDEAKFSDPLSNSNTKETERKLLKLADQIYEQALSSSIEEEHVAKARSLLAIRNFECLHGK